MTDEACRVSEAEQMYAGLLRLGKIATIARYHGEGHVPEQWLPENYRDFRRRVGEWFDRYIKEAGSHGASG